MQMYVYEYVHKYTYKSDCTFKCVYVNDYGILHAYNYKYI